MAKTKARRKKTVEAAKSDKTSIDQLLNELDIIKNLINKQIDSQLEECLQRFSVQSEKMALSIPHNKINQPISELNSQSSDWYSSCITESIHEILNATKLLKPNSSKQTNESLSSVESSYYTLRSSSLTSTSSNDTRNKPRFKTNSTRISRSMSRSKNLKTRLMQKTPQNRCAKLNSYGTVTPKVKPNTPQVFLRRPNMGEVAFSLEGSPLFMGSATSGTAANVNIPLVDGRLLSIQARKGLRLSQIPQLDAGTKRQLETLRDNLNKMCAIRKCN